MTRHRKGFSLLELVVVLGILAALATVALRAVSSGQNQTRYQQTTSSLNNIRDAIVGPANQHAADGTNLVTGFIADMGRLPLSRIDPNDPFYGRVDSNGVPLGDPLSELFVQPSGVPVYGSFPANHDNSVSINVGWQGPYVRLGAGAANLRDGWGNSYRCYPHGSNALIVADGISIGQIASWDADNVADTNHNGSGPLTGYEADVSIPDQNDLAGGLAASATLTGYVTMNSGSAPPETMPAVLPAETPTSGPAPNTTYTDSNGAVHNVAVYVAYFGPDLTATPNPVAEVPMSVTAATNWSYTILASNVTPGPRILKAYVVDSTLIPDLTHFTDRRHFSSKLRYGPGIVRKHSQRCCNKRNSICAHVGAAALSPLTIFLIERKPRSNAHLHLQRPRHPRPMAQRHPRRRKPRRTRRHIAAPRGWSLVNAQPTKDEDLSGVTKRRRGILPPASIDIELGLRMLANMLDGGLTLMAALKTCADQARRARMAKIWDDIHDRIAGGMSFAEAMQRHRTRFPKLIIQLTRAGEISGNLEIVLEQAADQMERRRNLLATLFSGMMYPAFATLVSVLVTAYLMTSVIPELAKFLLSDNRKLPAMTIALIGTSHFITTHFWQITIVSVTTVIGLVIAHKNQQAALVMDAITLRIPIVGKLLRLAGTSMFARGLSMMLEAGVPVLSALETAGGLMKNQAIVHRVDTARQAVLAGNSLAKPLAAGKEFLPMLPRMVAVGEETGTLSGVLIKVASFHERQLEAYVKRLTILIEPVMTVVVGTIVGFVYLAFFMALYSIIGSNK